jgi:WD40 repeat protein/uncharacterized caspase-like protein
LLEKTRFLSCSIHHRYPRVLPMCPVSLKTSDSTQILATGKAKMWILLVGVNQYQDEQFPPLEYSAVDCQDLGVALDAATQEFPCKQLVAHHDFAQQQPTLAAVSESLKRIATAAKSQDTVLVYFSGHGVIEQVTQQAVLCLSDTRNEALLDTGLKMQDLLQQLDHCKARQQLVWLDACHSGSLIMRGAKGLDEPTVIGSFEPTAQLVRVLRTRSVQSKGFYALLSCDEGQRSWEFPELGHGVFTYYLIRGLQGDAADHEGVIDADSLYRYVYHQTTQYINQKNQQIRSLNEEIKSRKKSPLFSEYPAQTPKRIVDGVGELVIGLVSGERPGESSSAPALTANHFGTHKTEYLANASESRGVNHPEQRLVDKSPVDSEFPLTPIRPTQQGSSMSNQPTQIPHSQASLNAQTETTVIATRVANRQLAALGYAAAGLAIAGAIFVLPGALGWHPQLLKTNSPATKASSQPCTLPIETLNQTANQPFNAQIALPNCAASAGWDKAKVETFMGRLGAAWWVAPASNGSTLATVSGNAVLIWDLRTQKIVHTLKGHKDVVHTIALSPDSKVLATGSADKTIRIWDVETGKLLQTLTGHKGVLWSVAFTPDGQTLASGAGDRTIKIWDLKTGKLVRTLTGHKDRLFPVAFSPDGRILASGGRDKLIKIWDWKAGKELRTLTGHTNAVRALTFDPAGKRIASAGWDSTIRVWDVQTGKELYSFTGHDDRIISVAISPDGKTLASAGIDNTVRLWDLDNRTPLATLSGHPDWILSVAFSQDGNSIVSGGRDGTIAVWHK